MLEKRKGPHRMNSRIAMRTVIRYALLWLALIPFVAKAQELKNLDYITMKGGEVFVVKSDQPEKLDKELDLPGGLSVSTNGVVKTQGKEVELKEGQKLTLDGYWLGDDGLLVPFQDHYTLKDGKVYFVQNGMFKPVNEEVVFKNGVRLKTDGTINTSSGMVLRLQSGQMLSPDGEPLQAKDHVMMKDGKLLIQRDGAFVTLAPGTLMGMSDGTKVKSDGTIITQGGQTFTLKEGDRLTLDGAAMTK